MAMAAEAMAARSIDTPMNFNMIREGLGVEFADSKDMTKVMNTYPTVGFNAVNNMHRIQFEDAAVMITTDEIEAIKDTIQHVLRRNLVTPRMVSIKNIGKGLIKWTFFKWTDVLPPRYTRNFDRGKNVMTSKEDTTIELIGFDYDYHIPMPQVDVYNNPNRKVKFSETLEQGNMRELTASLAQYREWSLFRGTDIPNMTDLGKTGLVNDAGITDPGAMGIGEDDDLTAIGDIFQSATVIAGELMDTALQEPPYQLHMTPKVLRQSLKNKETSSPRVTDFRYIWELGRDEGMTIFDEIIMNPYLIDSDVETNSSGAMMGCKAIEDNFEVIESYPLGFYPMPPQDLGIDGKLLWMGGMAVYRPATIVFADSLVTDV